MRYTRGSVNTIYFTLRTIVLEMLGRFLAIYAILGGFGLIFEPHLLEPTITHGGYRTIDYASAINQL